MKKEIKRCISVICTVILLLITLSCTSEKEATLDTQRVKVALRAVGNELLLSNKDSTSLVLPVIQKAENTFELTFEKPLAFDPTSLNVSTSTIFKQAELPQDYLIEVIQCHDGEVAYSYEMSGQTEKNIIPCGGRLVPENCYIIKVIFGAKPVSKAQSILFYVLVMLVLAFLAFVFYSRYSAYHSNEKDSDVTVLGSFRFYPEQNKLVKQAVDIPLSRKECELLAIFVAKPNQLVTREELTKQVWEDNGVIVGRSLDTYISKLRKKLQEDDAIKLTNVHGVGYKLEVEG